MAGTVYTAVTNILKDLYLDSPAVETEMYSNKPLLNWLPKEFNVPGPVWLQTVGYALSSGVSNTFSNAQAQVGYPNAARFSLTPIKVFGIEQLDRFLMEATKGEKGALINLTTEKFKLLLEAVSWKAHRQVYRSGTGVIGQRSSASTNTITLTNAADAAHFYKGMTVVASAADGGALRSGSTTVAAVNRGRSTSTITLTSAAAITSFADSDYLYNAGDAANNSTNLAISGLEAWFPNSVTATTFGGVDRTVDVQNLAGCRIDAATEGLNARDSIEALITEIQTISGMTPDIVFTTPRIQEAIRLASSDAIRFVEVKGTHELIIKGFEILGVPVVADYACPSGKAFGLSKDALSLKFTGSRFPDIVDEDGSNQSRMASEDSYEMRTSNYCQLMVKKPIRCGVAYGVPNT